jgi:hypothetical protein
MLNGWGDRRHFSPGIRVSEVRQRNHDSKIGVNSRILACSIESGKTTPKVSRSRGSGRSQSNQELFLHADARPQQLARMESAGAMTLRGAPERNDGQMLATLAIFEAKLDHRARPSSNERMRRGARRPTRPSGSRFEARPTAGWDLLHPGVRDADLLVERRDLPPNAIVLGVKADLRPVVVCRPAAGNGERDARPRD